MRNIKLRSMVAMAAAILSLAALPACREKRTGAGDAKDLRIIVVSHGQQKDPFWSVVKNGVDSAAREMGIAVEYRAPATFDMTEMAKLIDNAVAKNPDGLVVTIPDADALKRPIENAVKRSIPVVSMNSGSDVYEELGIYTHVGQTEYEAGLGAGKRMRKAGIRKALCINPEVGNVALDLRCKGFSDGLEGAVEVVSTSSDPIEVETAVGAKLRQDSEIDGILAVSLLAGEPLIKVIKSLKGRKIQAACFDLSETVLRAVVAGDMEFLIDQQQYMQGYLPIIFLTQFNQWGTMPTGVVMTGPGFVTKKNALAVIKWSAQGYR